MQRYTLILTLLLCIPPALWSANAPSELRTGLPLTDSPSLLAAGVHGPGGDLAIRFTHRKFAADLEYQVQQSIDLVNWTTIWRTADSFAHPLVTQQSDQGGIWLLTVDSSTDTGSGPETFLRVVVSKTP